jgi:hypothetical protein
MTYKECTFEDRLTDNIELHDKSIRNLIMENISNHLILYGPCGVGKYTLALSALQHNSPSRLKYYKKLHVLVEKTNIIVNMSDIHYEIDCNLILYNPRVIWNGIFQQILESITTPGIKTIICKEFQLIPYDLLECFYIYMQEPKIRFIILTSAIGFIPDQITGSCSLVPVPRPSKKKYMSILKDRTRITHPIINIQYPDTTPNHIPVCLNIIKYMLDIEHFEYIVFRNTLYDILVYNIDLHDCIWYILHTFIHNKHIDEDKIPGVITETINMLAKYNNNYHNIYHIEYYCCYLVSIIHGLR